MIIDGLGRAYVGDLGFDLPPAARSGAGRPHHPGDAGRQRARVADGLRFPNAIAISADHRRLVVARWRAIVWSI